jgi:SHS2 domain-containing protein
MSGVGSFRFVEGATSDLAFTAKGATPAEVFCAAAEALCAATVERPEAVAPKQVRALRFEDSDLELLLLRLLNELVYLRDAEGLVLRPVRAAFRDAAGRYELELELAGEELDPARHGLASDVKAATAHGLAFTCSPEGWQASVTLDV